MNAQFLHKAELGFILWADNFICNRAQAFTTTTERLYPMVDPRLPTGWVSYSSPFKSWICDSGVNGAYIPNSISGSFGTILEGQSGMMIDFDNGRVIFTGGSFPTNLVMSGTFSAKDFNIYPSNDGMEALIVENKYFNNSRYNRAETGVNPYDYVTPAIAVNISISENKPWAIGGLRESRPIVTALIMADTDYQLQSALSVFTDSSEKYFPQLEMSQDPIGVYGNLKSGYNYSNISSAAPMNDFIFIESVRGSKVSDRVKGNQELYYGLLEFRLSTARTT
jgi:hypothetical protein